MKPKQNKAYNVLVDEIAQVVQQSQVYAVQSVQRTASLVYWEIGKLIIEKQQQYGWGTSIVENLSMDILAKIGAAQSWSARSLRLMRRLYEDYSQATINDESNEKQAVSHLQNTNGKQPVADLQNIKQLISEVPWGQNILILQKVKDTQTRYFISIRL